MEWQGDMVWFGRECKYAPQKYGVTGQERIGCEDK